MKDYATLCPGCFAGKGTAVVCPHCGYSEAQPRGLLMLPPRTLLIDQYLVGRVLGKPGGFGITYLAWDVRLEMRVAIKEYFPREHVSRDADHTTLVPYTGDDETVFRYGLEQFLQEARTVARIDHLNVVRVRNFFEANGTGYMVMDYYEGMSLAEYLEERGGRLPEDLAVRIMMPVLDGLRVVHAQGVLHRDIDPHNIYLTQQGRPIVLDFGAARAAMGERSKSLSVILKAGYAPHEQYASRGRQGPWTDIYACAATLYRMVTGQVPPDAMSRKDEDTLAPPEKLEPSVSPPLSRALMHGLAVETEDRPATVEQFQQLLTGGVPSSPPPPPPPPLPSPPPPPPPPKPVPVYVWAGGAVVLLALVAYLFWPGRAVRISNDTGQTLYYVYLKDDAAEDWGEDRLGSGNTLAAGESFRASFSGNGEQCLFDLRARDGAGRIYLKEDQNLCEQESLSFAAQDQAVEAVNRTGHALSSLNVSPDSSQSWGTSVLADGVTIANAASYYASLGAFAGQCVFDLRAGDGDGRWYTRHNMNLCDSSAVTFVPPNRTIAVSNATGHVIRYLYIAEDNAPDWGSDLLGTSVLSDGGVYDAPLASHGDLCTLHVRAKDGDGRTYVRYNVDLCHTSPVRLDLDNRLAVVRNATGSPVTRVYVKPDEVREWGDNLLGDGATLAADKPYNVWLSRYGDRCAFDVCLGDAGTNWYCQDNVDLCVNEGISLTAQDRRAPSTNQ